MSLATCPECKREVSDKAEVCQHCGYPLEKEAKKKKQAKVNKILIKFWIGIVAFLVLVSLIPETKEKTLKIEDGVAKDYVVLGEGGSKSLESAAKTIMKRVYKIAHENPSVKIIDLTCYMHSDQYRDEYGNKPEGDLKLNGRDTWKMGGVSFLDLDEVRKYTSENLYVQDTVRLALMMGHMKKTLKHSIQLN